MLCLAFDLDLDLLGLASRRGVLLRDLDRPLDLDLARGVSSGGNSELRRVGLSTLVVSGGGRWGRSMAMGLPCVEASGNIAMPFVWFIIVYPVWGRGALRWW